MNVIVDSAQKLWAPARQLAEQGISGLGYLTELTWLLLLKVAKSYRLNLPLDYDWPSLVQYTSDIEQYLHYKQTLTVLSQIDIPYVSGIFAQAHTALTQPAQLTSLIKALTVVDSLATEDLACLYDRLLARCAREHPGCLGIVPQSLADTLVILTQPQCHETIQDPLAGTANLLVAAEQYTAVVQESTSATSAVFLGMEPDLPQQRLALMNCLLHRVSSTDSVPVQWEDSLLLNPHHWPQADVVLSMLNSIERSSQHQHDTSLALLKYISQILNPGGRAAVIVPDYILSAAGPAQQVRALLLDTCVLHTVLRLPLGIFYPHKIAAHVLFFRRRQQAEESTQVTWFYDARSNVTSHHCTSRDCLVPFEMVYGDDPGGQAPRHSSGEAGRWQCFERSTLAAQGDRLDQCWLQVDTKHTANPEPLTTILNNTLEELAVLSDLLR